MRADALMQLTDHFSWYEATHSDTATSRGIDNRPQEDRIERNIKRTARYMEQIRMLLGNYPLRITSWYRSPQTNLAVGGSKTSAHMQGLAVDFQHTRWTLNEAFEAIARATHIPFDQLILEGTRDGAHWIHIGFTEGTPRREIMTASGARLGGPMAYTRVRTG